MAAQYIQDTMKLKKAPFYNGSYVLNDDNLEKYVKSFCNEVHFKVQIEKNNDENLYVFNCRGVCIEIGLFTVEFDDLEINRIDVEIWNKDCTQFVRPGFFELHNVIGLIKDGTI